LAPTAFNAAIAKNEPHSYYFIWQGDVASGTLHEIPLAQQMLSPLSSP
jgi:hypothetical protein